VLKSTEPKPENGNSNDLFGSSGLIFLPVPVKFTTCRGVFALFHPLVRAALIVRQVVHISMDQKTWLFPVHQVTTKSL
jgi:hypothetical protein